MPKINITEVDNSQPGTRAYSNFTVVVPGFHAPYFNTEDFAKDENADVNGIVLEKLVVNPDTKVETWQALTDEDVFGKTGIREITSVADFEKYIGYVRPDSSIKASYEPVREGTVKVEGNKKILNFTTVFGEYIEDIDLDGTSVSNVTYTEPDVETKYAGGELQSFTHRDIIYTCTKNIDDADTKETLLDGSYTIICEAQEVDVPAHYGNQIAYELLNMGYVVYYVNMGAWYPSKVESTEVTEEVETEVDGETQTQTVTTTVVNEIGKTNIFNAIKALGTDEFWADLRDKTTYDFRFVLTGLIEGGDETTRKIISYVNEANRAISTLADYENYNNNDVFNHTRKRGDCLALIDLDEAAIERTATSGLRPGAAVNTKKIVNAIKSEIRTLPASINKYSAIFCSSVTYTNNSNAGLEGVKPGTIGYNNSRFPASFHYLACFDNMLANNYREWFAVAGFTRGVATYNIGSTRFDLGDLAVQALEPRYKDDNDELAIDKACNVIVRNRNSYYLWGNRTAHQLKSELVASHFLNIRQLCISIKKYVYSLCRNFTFDPNSDMLWRNFMNKLTPLLETMKANQGLRDYSIDKLKTNLKGTLAARIRIVPIEAVEDFDIELALEDSLNGTTATVTD